MTSPSYFDEIIPREGTDSYKLKYLKDVCGRTDVIPMWVADMDFRTPPFVMDTIQRRLQQGMVDEVKSMLDDGVSEEFLVKLGLEYKYLTWYLTGKIGYEQMVEELGSAIKRFAKRQMTWFRRDPRIIWLDMKEDPVSRASELITDFLGTGA